MRRTMLAVIVACLLAGGGWVAGQQAAQFKVPVDPYVVSGADIGFRVEATTPGGVIGTWLVRLKSGEWVPAHSAPTRGRVIPLDSQ